MKRNYIFLILVLFALTTIIAISCKKEDNNPNPPVQKDGNFRVFVRNGTNWYVGADVMLYLSEADRTAGNPYRTGVTTIHSASDSGHYVQFDTLPYRKYYLKANYNDTVNSILYIGTEDQGKGVWPIKDSTLRIHIFVEP